MRAIRPDPRAGERGVTLVEMLIALVVLAVGVLALAQTFPAGTRTQTRTRLFSTANAYVQEQAEFLGTRTWADAELALGRHPATGFDTLGTSRTLRRHYEVTAMADPLDNLRKVTIRVEWTNLGARACSTTIYARR